MGTGGVEGARTRFSSAKAAFKSDTTCGSGGLFLELLKQSDLTREEKENDVNASSLGDSLQTDNFNTQLLHVGPKYGNLQAQDRLNFL